MIVLIVLVILAMTQFDRQYNNVLTIKQQNEQLAADVARVKRQISDLSANGVSVSQIPGNGHSKRVPSTQPVVDAFTCMIDAEKQPDFSRGGWFLDNFGTKVGKLTPLISTDVYGTWVQNIVMEPLTVRRSGHA